MWAEYGAFMSASTAAGLTALLADGIVELCWVMSGCRSDGLNYYNIYNKDIGTGGIKVFFAGRTNR